MSDLRESLTQTGTLIGYINTIVYAHNYNDLTNKPQINGVTLSGNKTASDLGLVTPQTEAVTSVNSKTGAVVLDGSDINYDSGHTINQQIDAVAASIDYPVTSVNSKTGDVVLDGTDISFDGTYNVVQKIEAVEAEIPVVDYPVTSVNEQTGDVVLDGDDIAYNSSLSVNQKIDAVEAEIPVINYPVTSVAGKTGAVNLYASDIMCPDTATGSIATFTTSLEKPLVGCECGIVASQSSGTPTPSNPLPITGYTGMTITRNDGQNPPVEEDTYSVSWQDECGTIYGGSLDVTSGVLTKSFEIYDLGSNNWSMISPTATIPDTRFYCNALRNVIVKPQSTVVANGCCDVFTMTTDRAVNTTQTTLENVLAIGSDGYIYVRNNDYSDANAFKTAMSGHKLVYELETPVTYNLTPTEIETLVGTNNVFCDTNGNTNVTYLETIKEYIDKRVTP